MAATEIDNVVTTKLLTLLNASATKIRTRKRDFDYPLALPPVKKMGGKRVVVPNMEEEPKESEREPKEVGKEGAMVMANDEKDAESSDDPFNAHFGASSRHLTDIARRSVEERQWKTSSRFCGKLGSAVLQIPEGVNEDTVGAKVALVEKLEKQASVWKSSKGQVLNHARLRVGLIPTADYTVQRDLLIAVSSYQDLYWTKMDIKSRQPSRQAITLHCLNHILKIRRRVLKNNERLSSAKESALQPEPTTLLDQGFTRPSVLILLPFRSFAHAWITALLEQLRSHQVENRLRFDTEFTLPAGATDKLLVASYGTYPDDHVENFKGNIDDSFRVGVKVTRKTIKLFSDFYSSDIIVASPLGLKQVIEKEKHGDFLSSIEILVVDQLDVLTMQNWSHLQLVFSHLNLLPKESHDSDFSRIKPWYLDGRASYLRQSILLSSYETPETRSFFNKELKNVAGKIRTQVVWSSVQVPEGTRQNFMKFECISAKDEINKRFEFFTMHTFPELLKSAMQSANTVIFIPSYFDYCRVRNWLKARGDVTFAILSEDSDNKSISRARQAFFAGMKQFLLVTERFHFFRRYKIRGVRNVIFYAPPDHAEFYTELLSFPFLDDGVVAEDVTTMVIYSKYDYMRLERIVGSKNVRELVGM